MCLYLVYGFFFGFKNLKTTILKICVKTFQVRIMTGIFRNLCQHFPFLDHALICSVVKADTKKVLCT